MVEFENALEEIRTWSPEKRLEYYLWLQRKLKADGLDTLEFQFLRALQAQRLIECRV